MTTDDWLFLFVLVVIAVALAMCFTPGAEDED